MSEWSIVELEPFSEWFDGLSVGQQDAVTARIRLLRANGPTLGRPVVDHIEGSEYQNMKELRASKGGLLRVLFIFDPVQQIVLLLGGDKRGNEKKWYAENVPRADALYNEYLKEIDPNQ